MSTFNCSVCPRRNQVRNPKLMCDASDCHRELVADLIRTAETLFKHDTAACPYTVIKKSEADKLCFEDLLELQEAGTLLIVKDEENE
jgi:hypothetical protein